MRLRHGDVLVDKIERQKVAALKALPRSRMGAVLAEGEKTGHRHYLSGRNVELYELATDPSVKICRVGAGGATLRHEEHGPLELPPGDYRVTIKRQYSPEGWESVQD